VTTDVLQRDSAVPLYAQLEEILRAKIAGGDWQTNQRIPSENELNKLYGVSRMTARGVLTKLVNDGLLFRVAGKGTFLAPVKISAVSPAYAGIREQLESMGYQTSTKLLSIVRETPSVKVRKKLRLGEGQDVYALHRVRFVQGEPISLHRSYVPAHLAPDLDKYDTVNEQLCVVLETNFSLAMSHVEENLEAVSVATKESDLLQMRKGQPVLLLEDLISDVHGTPFEYSSIVFRGDKISLRFDYKP